MDDQQTPVAVERPRLVPFTPKVNDSAAAWSPEQLLEELLADLRAGKIHPTNLMVYWMDDEGAAGNRLRPRRWIANVTRAEEVAFHMLGALQAIDEWRT